MHFARREFKGSVNTSVFGDDEPILVKLNRLVKGEISKSMHVKKIDLEHRVQCAGLTSPFILLRHTTTWPQFDDVYSSAVPASRIERNVNSLCGTVDSSKEIRLSSILQRQRCGQGGTLNQNKKRDFHLTVSQETRVGQQPHLKPDKNQLSTISLPVDEKTTQRIDGIDWKSRAIKRLSWVFPEYEKEGDKATL